MNFFLVNSPVGQSSYNAKISPVGLLPLRCNPADSLRSLPTNCSLLSGVERLISVRRTVIKRRTILAARDDKAKAFALMIITAADERKLLRRRVNHTVHSSDTRGYLACSVIRARHGANRSQPRWVRVGARDMSFVRSR